MKRPESDVTSGHQKFYAEGVLSNICRIHFHIRSNAGIMAGNRDPVKK